jgi:pyridoxal phosphate enzyme (YggS family)
MENISKNLTDITERIAKAATQANRDPDHITLVAVSKKMLPAYIQAAIDWGHLCFGENYIQEAQEKIPKFANNITWHFIGHLQSNKVRQATELFDVIQTVDSLKLATALNNHLAMQEKTLRALIQVNVSGEKQKSGIPPDELEGLLQATCSLSHLKITGLMTIPPFYDDPEKVRPYFRHLAEISQKMATKKLIGEYGPVELSMGMSDDFEVAIEEGATIVRVGNAIFGPRPESTPNHS